MPWKSVQSCTDYREQRWLVLTGKPRYLQGMRYGLLLILLAFRLATIAIASDAVALSEAERLELKGDFKEATEILTRALADTNLAASQRGELTFERDRLTRIRKDYPFTRDELFAALLKSVRDLTREEFESWVREGRFDAREIDGQQRFMISSVSNLYFRHPELESRRMPPKDRSAYERTVLETARSITKAAAQDSKPYVLPKQFHVTMRVTVKSNAVPPGEAIRAWLPIPRAYPFQSGFRLIESSSRVHHLDSEASPIRSLQLEQTAATNSPTEFRIEYEYTAHGVRFDVKPENVRPYTASHPGLKPFLEEAPHVIFTPQMRALSKQIAGGATNDYVKARKFYDWIAENIKYSYALEYSTIRNISEYCRSKGYGDCGQEALLFITLCRINGIPARWQSGWSTIPGGKTIHDWSEIYLEPYGWIPVDPYMGIWATRYSRALSKSEKREVRDFYFGGLDQWRMIANSDHNQTLVPAKRALRSDTVDFQRGELEWGDNNLYFDQYDYELTVRELGSE